ncbi:uncharacterized protein [Lolium perenne]|uniref:uncharacterized protein n=1 Tax=Lolium perenne TaxID=4522 RepID=UPI003A98E013
MDPFEIHRDLEQEDLFEDIIRDGPEADREERDSGDGEDRGSGDGEADGSGDGEADGSGHGEASEDKLEKRGPAKRLSPKDHFTIEAISPKGQPVAPAAVRVTFKNPCGVLVRDRLPITIREWNKTKNVSEDQVADRYKDTLFDDLMTHFTLPVLRSESEMAKQRALVKKWALQKMGELFRAYKNRLWATYKAEKKPPLFENYLAKQEHNWEEFVKYKESEEAMRLSKKNKKNASEKKYHHHTGRGGYEKDDYTRILARVIGDKGTAKKKDSASTSKSSARSVAGKKSSSTSAPLKAKQAATTGRKRKEVPQLGEQAKQSIPPLKVSDVPSVYQEHGDFDLEAAAALAAQVGCTVEELLSAHDAVLPIADIAPKFVYGADLVSKERLHKLPTHMRNLHQWYIDACKENTSYIVADIPEDYYFRKEEIHIEMNELWQLFNLDALDKSLMSCYCLLKIIECRSNKMFNVGFVDPDKVHHDTVKNNVEETGGNLLRFIGEQSFCDSILFPYNYSFHWILLNIQVDKGIVEVRDPLSRGLDGFRDLQNILQRCWRALKNNIAGNFAEKLTFTLVPCAQQPQGTNLCGYYVCESIRMLTTEKHNDNRFNVDFMREKLQPHEHILGITEELAGLLMKEVIDDNGLFSPNRRNK